MGITDQIRNISAMTKPAYGTANRETGQVDATPWYWSTNTGVYVNKKLDVWVYRVLPLHPLEWEDAPTRLEIGNRLQNFFKDLEQRSRSQITTTLASVPGADPEQRQVHILTLSWEEIPHPPKGSTDAERAYLEEIFENRLTPNRACFIGVKLMSNSSLARVGNLMSQIKNLGSAVLGESGVPKLEPYEDDFDEIVEMFGRYRLKEPTSEQTVQLESWYALGKRNHPLVAVERDRIVVDDIETLEFAAMRKMAAPEMRAPWSKWVADALAHPDGPRVVSIRAELQDPETARRRLRGAQRKILNSLDEEAQANELTRVEYSSTAKMAKLAEDFFAQYNEPLFTKVSVVMGRRQRRTTETYADWLRTNYGVVMEQLSERMLFALEETLPAARAKTSPWFQDMTLAMISYAGIAAFDSLGDNKGIFVGLSQQDLVPVYLDPGAVADENTSPTTLIIGDPGSGKSFKGLEICIQGVLCDYNAIFINPKPNGRFDRVPKLPQLKGRVRAIHMSALEDDQGAFDPFSFIEDPKLAAEVLNEHISSVMGNEMTLKQRLALENGIVRGALSGAKCAYAAMTYVDPDYQDVVDLVKQQCEVSSLFALALAKEPQDSEWAIGRGLTMIEFDRRLPLPEAGVDPRAYTPAQKIALAALRLAIRASMELLIKSKGGILCIDEAWTLLGNSEGKNLMQALNREARSQGILPIYITQQARDALDQDMEGFFSRVFVGKLQDMEEARAAIQLCGMKFTKPRYEFLLDAGPIAATATQPAQPALFIHRDIKRRKGSIIGGPTAQWLFDAITTNAKAVTELEAKALQAEGGVLTYDVEE